MTTQVILIRHGQTDWNVAGRWQGHSDIPLNDTGRSQARALAQRLKKWQLTALYTSDLSRAAETAAIIGQAVALEPIPMFAWRERFCGDFEGLTNADIAERFPEQWAKLQQGHLELPNGETAPVLLGRIMPAFEALIASHQGQRFAIVSHGGVLRLLISTVLGLDAEAPDRLSVSGNTGLSVFQIGEHGYRRLSLLNDTAHLEFQPT